MRAAEYPAAERVLLHLSDTHLRARSSPSLFDRVDGRASLARILAAIEASRVRPDAIVVTGDLADLGEPAAYRDLRALLDPCAQRLGTRVFWVMGNHDDRGAFRASLLDAAPELDPVDRVDELNGLRLVTLDTTVPGAHHGELADAQLAWLADVLATPAPFGTILAMHHPPVPSVLPLAASVELRDQRRLAAVVRGSDVRTIIAGHLHYSTFATFAGIPVSVASSTCYTQDLTVPVGGSRPQDGAQGYNLVHVFDDTVVHSVVPVGDPQVLEHIPADEAQQRLAQAGVGAYDLSLVRPDAPTEPIPSLR